MEREDLKKMLGEFMPVHVQTKKTCCCKRGKTCNGQFKSGHLSRIKKFGKSNGYQSIFGLSKNTRCTGLKPTVYTPEAPIPLWQSHHLHYTCTLLHSFSSYEICKRTNLFLYLVATGCVVTKPHRCKSVLYYELCWPVQSTSTTIVAVSEMLSSDQSTPIQNWLNCLSRDFMYMYKQSLQPQKVETDFTWAIIHATLHTFCQCNIHKYLQQCLEECLEGKPCAFTVVHLCAVHMKKLLF